MNHFFANPQQIVLGNEEEPGSAYITGGDVSHIRNVLRMKVGEELLLSDGQGNDYHCVIAAFEEADEPRVLLSVLEAGAARSELPVRFYLFQGLPKADKLETIIQKTVELGVFEIIPVEMARCVVKYDAGKQKKKTERWQKIAESAAKQSKRGIIPQVKEVMRFSEALAYAADLDLVLLPYENYKDMKATKEALSQIRSGMRVGFFIGPEGGFEEKEVQKAMQKAVPISLGSRILRTETAPLMLLSVLSFQLEE